MINQRKKKRKDAVDPNSINNSWSSYTSGYSANWETSEAELLDDSNTELGKLKAAQINTIQENADLRADAEDSNLDLLDRGSRYTRKNKKLKEFNDAKSAKV